MSGAWSNASESSTSAGKRNAAICATEFFTTEIARSDLPFAARVIPTTFSTAFPAIATITRPVNAFEMPSDSTAGSSAAMNQSETSAAATPPTASTTSAGRTAAPAVRCSACASSAGVSERR